MLLNVMLCVLQLLSGLLGNNATLVFAGDAMQHDRQLQSARKDGGYDYSRYFTHISDYIQNADYAVVNLECSLGGAPYRGYPCFSAPDAFAESLKTAGFDLFLHANNHCLDRSDAGLVRTLDVLDRLSVPHVGTYRNQAERDSHYPFVTDVNGFKIAFLNYTYGTNGIEPRGNVVVDYIDRQKIRADIRKAREKGAEIVTVCIHWGVEYKLVQNKEQEDLAKFLADEGVDLIIGGHPHVIQPMKVVYNARHDKKVLIVYSLGNFVSGMRTADTRGGAMVKVELHRVNGKACLDTAKYKLFFVQEPEKGGSYEVIPADKDHLIRKNVYPLFEKFESNATAIFEKHNIGVEKDAWKWIPNVLIPMFVEEGTEK